MNEVIAQTVTTEQNIFSFIIDKIPYAIGAILVVIVSFIIAGLLKRLVLTTFAEHSTDDQVSLLIGKVTHIGTLILGFTIALKIVGIDITGIVGMFTLGFGFALQDIIKNFICGALILIQQPFRIGDVIKVGEYFGIVETIESRSTNIKNFNGQRIIIPNANVFSQSVTNFSAHPERRSELIVGVAYGSNLAQAGSIILNILKNHDQILENPEPTVLFTEFGDSSINISAKYWVGVTASRFSIQSMLIQQIKIAFDEAGIGIPFPMHTINIDYDKEFQSFTKDLKKDVKTDESPETKSTLTKLNNMVEALKQKTEFDHFSHENLKEEIEDKVRKVADYEKKSPKLSTNDVENPWKV